MVERNIKITQIFDENYLRAKYCYNTDITYECQECHTTCEGTPYFCDTNALCFNCLAQINEVKKKTIKEKKKKRIKTRALKNRLKRN